MTAQTQPKIALEERCPELEDAIKFLGRKMLGTREESVIEGIRKDYMTLTALGVADYGLEMVAIAGAESGGFIEIMLNNLPRLKDLANKYSNVGAALRIYTQRLQELTARDNRISEVSRAFQDAFGGQT